MKDKLKTALKRASSGLMAVLLGVCLVGTPKAEAVVLEGSYLGSVFGTVLSSLGYSWVSDNIGNNQFGEAIYSLMTDWASEKSDDEQTYLDNLADLFTTGLVAAGQGKLQLSYNIMNLARDFAEWFQGKFFASGNSTATVLDGTISFTLTNDSGDTLTYPSGNLIYGKSHSPAVFDYVINEPCTVALARSTNLFNYRDVNSNEYFIQNVTAYVGGKQLFTDSGQGDFDSYSTPKNDTITFTALQVAQGAILKFTAICGEQYPTVSKAYTIRSNIVAMTGSALTAEKPQEVHYPVVAEDGSQVYEITVDGVTATDIEGIIHGAVDRILAGTASIVGSVEQAGTGEVVTNPELEPYKVGLTSVFPFCIPFDIYNMVTMFVAEPEAPHAEWTFGLPWSNQEYSVGWDLSDFDGVAQVCRSMELVLFAVGLAVITHKVIKW